MSVRLANGTVAGVVIVRLPVLGCQIKYRTAKFDSDVEVYLSGLFLPFLNMGPLMPEVSCIRTASSP
jgi:hypothetical protein